MRTLYLESSELASELKAVLPRLSQRDLELARRVRRSAEELSSHSEESMLTTGRMRRFELRAAQAAAVELIGCLRAANSNGYLEPGELAIEARVEALRARLAGAGDDTRRVRAVSASAAVAVGSGVKRAQAG
jgi:hypothetical protein